MASLLKELLGGHPLEHIVLDDRLRILTMSDDAAQFAESPEAAVVGADIRKAFPEFVGAEEILDDMARKKRGEWKVRNVSRSESESRSAIDVSVMPITTNSPESLVVLIEDVTERAALEQRLIQHSNETKLLLNTIVETRNYYERILESMADALFVISSEGVVQTVNSAAMNLLGRHKAELVGNSLRTFLVSDAPFSSEHAMRNVEGLALSTIGEIPVSLSSSFIEDDSRNLMIVIARDLREKKSAESEISKLKTENLYLHEEVDHMHNFHEIVGKSAPIRSVFRQIEQVAATDSAVLLLGETGTGKELVAHAIHNLSGRRKNILVKVNCAALPQNLVESELFGHDKGAFTGAVARRIGRFEYANGGTILLDEISELPLETQSKLLRVLQEKEFERVGGTQPVRVDVRIIAATNSDLEEAVNNRNFRNDLFFRINVFPIRIPPLRERREDIPLLVRHYVNRLSLRMNKKITSVAKKAMDDLIAYDWPGNVRELIAVIERAMILCDGKVLTSVPLASAQARRISKSTSLSLEELERQHILSVLREVEGTIEGPKGAALRLGINPSTLRSRMKRLGISRQGYFHTA